MPGTCTIEFGQGLLFVRFLQRVHLLQQPGVRADGSLSEDDQAAGQYVGAFDSDSDRHRAIDMAR